MPAALGVAQVVTQLLSWGYLMPSYETTLTGLLLLVLRQASIDGRPGCSVLWPCTRC